LIPDGVATLLTFFGLVAPGLVLQLVVEKRQPRQSETAFREASRVALSSVVFTVLSVSMVAAVRALWPTPFPSLVSWRSQGWAYVAAHPGLALWPLVAIVVVSCGLAVVAGWWTTKGSAASIANYGSWYQTLRVDPPTKPHRTIPWLHIKMKDETQFWGHLRYYTDADDADVREIVLGGPTLEWQPKGADTPTVIGNNWDAAIANAEEIAFVRVVYQETARRGTPPRYHLRGRRTEADPSGREMS
jgi:hypothetical protein